MSCFIRGDASLSYPIFSYLRMVYGLFNKGVRRGSLKDPCFVAAKLLGEPTDSSGISTVHCVVESTVMMEEMGKRRRGGRCSLCGEGAAAVHCEADGATLRRGCDARVHSANFLVARHPRALLCRRCLSPTPWRAAGPCLPPALSLCLSCSLSHHPRKMTHQQQQRVVQEEEEEEDEIEEDADNDVIGEKEEEEGKEEEGENQVVPCSRPPLPLMTCSSGSSNESYSSSMRVIDNSTATRFLKRTREDADIAACQDDHPCSPSSFSGDFRLSKKAAARLRSSSSTQLHKPHSTNAGNGIGDYGERSLNRPSHSSSSRTPPR